MNVAKNVPERSRCVFRPLLARVNYRCQVIELRLREQANIHQVNQSAAILELFLGIVNQYFKSLDGPVSEGLA